MKISNFWRNKILIILSTISAEEYEYSIKHAKSTVLGNSWNQYSRPW